MIDATASARYAAQRSILENILGPAGMDDLEGMRAGIGRLKALALTEIGRAVVYADDGKVDQLRQSVHDLDATIDIIERLTEEAIRVRMETEAN